MLISRVLNGAIVIPERATFEVLNRRYVYVVNKEDVAHLREIVIQNELEDLFVIKKGVGVDDKIILEGIRQVHDGEKVKYEDRAEEGISQLVPSLSAGGVDNSDSGKKQGELLHDPHWVSYFCHLVRAGRWRT